MVGVAAPPRRGAGAPGRFRDSSTVRQDSMKTSQHGDSRQKRLSQPTYKCLILYVLSVTSCYRKRFGDFIPCNVFFVTICLQSPVEKELSKKVGFLKTYFPRHLDIHLLMRKRITFHNNWKCNNLVWQNTTLLYWNIIFCKTLYGSNCHGGTFPQKV